MPTRPLHHVSNLSRISTFAFRISPRPPRDAIMRNKPNFPYRWRLAGFPIPKHAKRTQFHKANRQKPTANSQKMRNEPNSTRPTAKSQQPPAKKCKTNPIYPPPPSHRPKYAKRTQFTARPHPNYAKRTQFPYRWRLASFPMPKYVKTNPITSPLLIFSSPLLHYSPSPLLPFSPSPLLPFSPSPLLPFSTTAPPIPHSAKRTQFPHRRLNLQSTIYNIQSRAALRMTDTWWGGFTSGPGGGWRGCRSIY